MIAHNPLHGSGQAGFPHPALALGDNAHAPQGIGMTDRRQRQSLDLVLRSLKVGFTVSSEIALWMQHRRAKSGNSQNGPSVGLAESWDAREEGRRTK